MLRRILGLRDPPYCTYRINTHVSAAKINYCCDIPTEFTAWVVRGFSSTLACVCCNVQATTTAQHTLRLEDFEGEEYEGALLYVTLSVNNFAYQSIEEVDPVDGWALLGTAGGVWGESRRRVGAIDLETIPQSSFDGREFPTLAGKSIVTLRSSYSALSSCPLSCM